MSIRYWTNQKSFDGYPLWMTIAWVSGLQLSWILSYGRLKMDSQRSNWPEFFSYGKTTSRAWWWPQKLARVISIQSIPTKWYFWAFFHKTVSLFWFSLFLLPLSGFWPFSFKPRPQISRDGLSWYHHALESGSCSNNRSQNISAAQHSLSPHLFAISLPSPLMAGQDLIRISTQQLPSPITGRNPKSQIGKLSWTDKI